VDADLDTLAPAPYARASDLRWRWTRGSHPVWTRPVIYRERGVPVRRPGLVA